MRRAACRCGVDCGNPVGAGGEARSAGVFLTACAVAAVATCAQAYGPWLEKTPIGGVELSDGWSRAELEKSFDEIAATNAARPFIVTRAKWLTTVFDHVRLAVNTNDLFVHWHPDCAILPLRFQKRLAALRKTIPASAGVHGHSTIDTSHTCPDWKSVLALGPKGLADRARLRRPTARTEDERIFLDCVAEVYDGLARECARWADFAAAKGMTDVAAVLRANAAHAPQTFREALQWALVYDRAQEAEGEDVRSQGLFDRLFIDFYRADLAAGRETRASAKKLVADWYTCFWRQQHDNNKNIAFGGYDAKGEPVWNELTELGFEVFRELGRINPKLTYRFGAKTPPEQLEKVTACIADGRNSIVFACEETLGEGFRRRGKSAADIADYVLIGCYEPGIQGCETIASMSTVMNIVGPLTDVLSRPPETLPKTGAELERAYLRELLEMIDRMLATTRSYEEKWGEMNPAPLYSGSFADCIERATDYSRGGCRHNQSGAVLMGLGTVVDSLAAVRWLVDEQKLVTLVELAAILKADWKGHEDLRLRARRATPKWGNNDDRADAFAKRIYGPASARVNATPNGHGGTFQAGWWTINWDVNFGRRTGATPEGRRRGDPFSRNNVATAGCGREGPTALMLSNLKLDLAEAPDGHIMDILLPLSVAKGADAAKNIAGIVAEYFRQGGQCLHLNCFDSALLREATAHPERYPDLQVRVCGWNVRWNDLSAVEKQHFIATAEAQE